MSFSNDFNYLKRDLIELISFIENENFEESSFSNDSKVNKQKLDELTTHLNSKLKSILNNVNEQVRVYFLYLFRDYNYSFDNGIFKETIKKYIVNQLLNDLRAISDSFQAFQHSFQGNVNQVKDFLSKYPKYKNEISFYGTTFLYSSSRNNHFELVQYLVDIVHCNVNQQNKDYVQNRTETNPTSGSTPLHAACFYGHLNIVKYLIDHGADYFILNRANETPIDNGLQHHSISQFFDDYLISSYSNRSTTTNSFPKCSILNENRLENDSIWEYRKIDTDQWIEFDKINSNQLQLHLPNLLISSQLILSLNNENYSMNLIQFQGQSNSSSDRCWFRSRCSSVLNFNFYSKWEILFRNRGSTLKNQVECEHWYDVDQQVNQQIDDAIHLRKRIVQIQFNFNKKIIFFQLNLFSFTFVNIDHQINGDLRWIPLLIYKQNQLTIDNYQSFHSNDIQLKYHQSNDKNNSNETHLQVRFGDLIKETSDAIVVSWSSEYLLGMIYELAGDSIRNLIQSQIQKRIEQPLIAVRSDGQIKAKFIFFLRLKIDKDLETMKKSYEQLINLMMRKANDDQLKSISFPTIGFNSIPSNQQQVLVQTIVQTFQQLQSSFPISVDFILQHDHIHVFDLFHKQIQMCSMTNKLTCQSIQYSNSLISIEKGDLVKEKVDVIVVSSASEQLRQILLMEAGNEIYEKYLRETQLNPNWLFLNLPSGNLSCQQIYFIKFHQNQFEINLKQSIQDFLSNVFQNVVANQFQSLAFPFMSFEQNQLSNQLLIKHFLFEICQQIKFRNLSLLIKFVVLPDQTELFELFRKELLVIDEDKEMPDDDDIISTWEQTDSPTNRFPVSKKSNEYKSIEDEFIGLMKGYCKKIVSIERIQNQRWFNQYQEHKKDFYQRLKKNTERRLFHGCPQHVTDSIIHDCFNRSFAGVNGTSYGVGVYFSSDPIYSNQFAKSNSNGERTMFVARVLIGNTTIGNSSMKTRPPGFDTTTDGKHIFVTYHDAQAYAQYLITYK